MEYEPYHVHTYYSNPLTQPDSCCSIQDYAKVFAERGCQTLALTEHGNRSNAWQQFELGKQYHLKPVVGAECYFVPSRNPEIKDKRNYHLVLLAKDQEGFYELNQILSEANETGFYYKARVDFDLLERLNAKHFLCTTACVAGPARDENALDFCSHLKEIFRDNFYLEVQPHPQQIQKEHNARLLDIYRKINAPLIFATDSHYINSKDAALRKELLKSANIHTEYEDEFDLFLPTAEQAWQLMLDQGVLSKAQIEEAMENTLVLREFEGVSFDTDKKIPNVFPEFTYDQRCAMYRHQVLEGYESRTGSLSEEDRAELEKEMNAVTETGTADYFLATKRIVDDAIAHGGILTTTGRGSGVSFATNYALGFTSVNRLTCPVRLFPDRFISKERLQSGSLPDLDLNVSNVEAFEASGQKYLGKYGCMPMIAFGKNKSLSSFKLLARARDLDFETSNKISKQLGTYEKELRHAIENNQDDPDYDPSEEVNIAKFVDEEYHDLIEESKQYQGIVMQLAPHPCAHLLLDRDIRREIGVIRVKSKSGSKDPVLAAYIDGQTADAYGYLKLDFLRVDVVKTIDAAFRACNMDVMPVTELLKRVENDDAVWAQYRTGCTIGLNQVERDKTSKRVQDYAPRNVVELAAFIAAVRPGFKSMLSTFISRKPFAYNIPSLDKLLQTKEIPSSFLLYDEQILHILQSAGIPAADAYVCVKAIKKKKTDKVMAFKDRFREGYAHNLMVNEGASETDANKTVDAVWKIIEDAASYMFCAAHAFCMACDSLYAAWLKAHYPYEFYITMLKIFTEKGKKEKVAAIIQEMRCHKNIRLQVGSYGWDNSDWTYDAENGLIFQSLSSMKYISKTCAKELAYLSKPENIIKFTHIVDLLAHIALMTSINSRQVEILIRTDYFNRFGKPAKILRIWNEIQNGTFRLTKSLVRKTFEFRVQKLKDLCDSLPNKDLPTFDRLSAEFEAIGLCVTVNPNLRQAVYFCTDVASDFSARVNIYSVRNGNSGTVRVSNKLFEKKPIEPGNILYVHKYWKNEKTGFIWLQEYDIDDRSIPFSD